MDWEMMKHVNELTLQRERKERETIRKQRQEEKDKHDALIGIIFTFLSILIVGFLGG